MKLQRMCRTSSSSLLVFETVSWCNSRLCSKANFLPFADGPEYFYSDRGKLRLKFEGYTYQKSNVGQSGRVYWRCEEARKIEMKCPAKLIASADGASFRRNKDHNHGPVIESSILTLDDIVEGIKKWGWIWFSHIITYSVFFADFEIFINPHGYARLRDQNGFLYHRSEVKANLKSYWCCYLRRNKKVKCPAKLIVSADQCSIEQRNSTHNHDADSMANSQLAYNLSNAAQEPLISDLRDRAMFANLLNKWLFGATFISK